MMAARVIVIPSPTAGPFNATIVGLRQRKIGKFDRPPLSLTINQSLRFFPKIKANVQVSTGTEKVSDIRQYDGLGTFVQVEHGVA